MEHILAKKLTNWCCCGKTDTLYLAAIEYGLELLIETLWKLAALLSLGMLVGKLREIVMTLCVFCGLRFWIGGKHRKTSIGCFGTMVLVCLIAVWGAEYMCLLPEMVKFAVLLLCNLIVLAFSPYPSEVNPITDETVIERKRWGGIITSIGITIIVLLQFNSVVQWILLLAFFLEAISILPNKLSRRALQ